MTRSSAPAADPAGLQPEVLFRALATARGMVLAVSGGPDSTALMLLMAAWSARPPTLIVAVDHGLRPEAAAEAQLVAENAERLGLAWRIMRAPECRDAGNLQDWARRARYACLAEAAGTAGFDTIVTAHHQEDQAETFLMRLARGSGVYGLASMAEVGSVDGLRVVRPLLRTPRARLAEIGAASGLPVADDASNRDRRFERVRMRELLPLLAENGLTASRLADTTSRLGRAAAALDHYAREMIRGHFTADPHGTVAGPANAFVGAPEEVSLRGLASLLRTVGGAEYTPRLDRVEALRAAILAAGEAGSMRRTLHGVEVSVTKGRFTARREWGRQGIAELPVAAGATLLWDRRFRVRVPLLTGELSVGPLGRLNAELRGKAALRALRAVPGLYRGGALVAAPHGVALTEASDPPQLLSIECLVAARLGLPPAAAETN